MKHLKLFSLNILIFYSFFFISSCSSVDDDQIKNVGKWKLFYSNSSDFFWDTSDVASVELKKNGEFVIGNKVSGNWGEYDESEGDDLRRVFNRAFQNDSLFMVGNILDLDFKNWKAVGKNINQLELVIGRVSVFQGVSILNIKIRYSYKDWGTFDHSQNGVTMTPNATYYGLYDYYYVKEEQQSSEIRKHFKEAELMRQFNNIDKLLKEETPIDDLIFDGSSLSNFRYANKESQTKWKKVFEHGIKNGKGNYKHQMILDMINAAMSNTATEPQSFEEEVNKAVSSATAPN